MKISEATWSRAFINDLPDSSFLHILPDGEKEDGKTTPRSLRMFPYKDAGGKVDLPHLRNALSRIPQSDRIDRATKTRLTTKARTELGTVTETSEMYDYPEQPVYSYGTTSFADLLAGERAMAVGDEAETRIAQFQMMAGRILANPETTDKVAAIEALAGELLVILAELFGEAATESPDTEPVEMGEAADFSITNLPVAIIGIQEGTDDNTEGFYVNVVPIQPGWGNRRDNHYYSRDLVEQIAPIWNGVKMYATDHKPEQKSVLTEVSQIVESPAGFTEDGIPFARAVILSAEFEDIIRRRANEGVLNDLHCSILATGTARPGFERDGRKGKYVESLTEAHSVDWVTNAGAGGHALAISESEVTVDKETLEKEVEDVAEVETDLEPVVVQEAETEQEPEAQPETPAEAEPPEPQFLSEADVSALVPGHLPQATQDKILAGEYVNETAAKNAIITEVEYLKAVTDSGRPIGVTTAQPQQLDLAEAGAAQRERQNAVNDKWFGR